MAGHVLAIRRDMVPLQMAVTSPAMTVVERRTRVLRVVMSGRSELKVQEWRYVRREEQRLHGEGEAGGECPASGAFRKLMHRWQRQYDRPAEYQACRDFGK